MTRNHCDLPKFGRSAEVRAASFDEADNTIEVIWTTGAAVRRRDWQTGRYYQEVLDVTPQAVRLDRLNAGAPFLNTHDDTSLSQVIGSVVPGSAKLEGGKGFARVKLSRAAEDAAIVEKIKDGIIRNISVGYAIHRVQKTESDVDGADDEWRVIDWEPLEISAVPVPADAGSQIRKNEQELTPCTFESETAATIRQRMERKQALLFCDGIEAIAQRHVASGRISQNLINVLAMARAAAIEVADPVEAAKLAYRCIDTDDEDRGAAYVAAFIFAAR
ncbi:MAG: HK97 family phage prohead protease [Rhizobiales bacterium]|nr:HK97 family phage prohead protease [Hyphomicrobiales bacterium]